MEQFYVMRECFKNINILYCSLFNNSDDKAVRLIKEYITNLDLNNNKIDLMNILTNSNNKIVDIIEELEQSGFIDKYNFYHLCKNSNDRVIKIIKKYLDESNMYNVEKCLWNWIHNHNINNEAAEILLSNLDKIKDNKNFHHLFKNPNDRIVDYILDNLDDKYFVDLCGNSNDRIVEIVLKNTDKFDGKCWSNLVTNSNIKILHYVKTHIDKIMENETLLYEPFIMNGCKLHIKTNEIIPNLCYNSHDIAFDILERYINKLDIEDWNVLAGNSNIRAFYLILEHNLLDYEIDKDWLMSDNLWSTSHIWTYNYNKMKQYKSQLHTELIYKIEYTPNIIMKKMK